MAQQITAESFGSGKYSPLMRSIFKDAQVVFGVSEAVANKLARQVATDCGAAQKESFTVAKIGKKLDKDGYVTLTDTSKAKGKETEALRVWRSLAWIAEAGNHGISWQHTTWRPIEPVQKYLDNLDAEVETEAKAAAEAKAKAKAAMPPSAPEEVPANANE